MNLTVAATRFRDTQDATARARTREQEAAMALGLAIHERRVALGLSFRVLGRQVGCSAMHLCDIEAGRRAPSESLLGRIEIALHHSVPTHDQRRGA